MRLVTGDQGIPFGPGMPSRPARHRQPQRQATVTISAEAIAAATVGRIDGERVIAEAIHVARPDVCAACPRRWCRARAVPVHPRAGRAGDALRLTRAALISPVGGVRISRNSQTKRDEQTRATQLASRKPRHVPSGGRLR
jgi:hypothetical protein